MPVRTAVGNEETAPIPTPHRSEPGSRGQSSTDVVAAGQEEETANIDTERSPLLPKSKSQAVTPLPKFQLFITLFLRVTEPIAFNLVFPFINQLLIEFDIARDPKQTGFYAGLIESIFAVTELTTVFYWGSLSDRIGRKPVLLIGNAMSAASAISFGFSRSFLFLIISRSINGLANGNVAVLKSVIGEITDETNQSRAFSFFPLSLAIGNILASSIGGYLPHITRVFPSLSNTFPFLDAYPYFLPCFVGALFPIVSGITAFFCMKETLPPKHELEHEEQISLRGLLADKDIRQLLISFTILSLEGISYGSLLPLFFFTPVNDGGLGFSEAQIGTALSIRGVATIAVQLFTFPWLVRTVGNTRLFNILMVLYIPTYLLLPISNAVARTGNEVAVWVLVTTTLLLGSISNMSFACNLIMTNDAAPNRRSLGALNGLAAFCSSLTRVVGPGSTNVLFALSVDRHALGGSLIWIAMVLLAISGVASGIGLKKSYSRKQ